VRFVDKFKVANISGAACFGENPFKIIIITTIRIRNRTYNEKENGKNINLLIKKHFSVYHLLLLISHQQLLIQSHK